MSLTKTHWKETVDDFEKWLKDQAEPGTPDESQFVYCGAAGRKPIKEMISEAKARCYEALKKNKYSEAGWATQEEIEELMWTAKDGYTYHG